MNARSRVQAFAWLPRAQVNSALRQPGRNLPDPFGGDGEAGLAFSAAARACRRSNRAIAAFGRAADQRRGRRRTAGLWLRPDAGVMASTPPQTDAADWPNAFIARNSPFI